MQSIILHKRRLTAAPTELFNLSILRGQTIKAVTLEQPFATLAAKGLLQFVPRPSSTRHRGPIAIHAAASLDQHNRAYWWNGPFGRFLKQHNIDADNLPYGAVIGAGVLVAVHMAPDVLPNLPPGSPGRLCGRFVPGWFAWQYCAVESIEPTGRITGRNGLWNWTVPSLTGEEKTPANIACTRSLGAHFEWRQGQ